MSEAPPAASHAMPLFYRNVVGINPATHGDLRLDRDAGYAFAATTQAVPLGLGEFDSAAQAYPIVFTAGAAPMPVALLGVREGENLFVDDTGAWRADSYVPAYVRAHPFIFVEDTAKKTTFVGMEAGAASLGRERGERLFEDGQASRVLNERIAFCSSLRDNLVASGLFARTLEQAGLLSDEEAMITYTAGGSARIRGFKLMQPERLAQIDDATFLDWRARGWIGAIYAHVHSAGRWGRLIELAAPRAASRAA